MRRIATTVLLALALTGCWEPEQTTADDRFVIETEHLRISVAGDPATFERNGAQLLARIDAVDPALIRPGIGLWVEPEDTAPHLPGRPKLVLVGRVVAVEPRPGGY